MHAAPKSSLVTHAASRRLTANQPSVAADVPYSVRSSRASSIDREARVGGDLPKPGVEPRVEVDARVGRFDSERIVVVVVAALDALDQFRHQMTYDRRVLELIAAGSDRHVEAVEVGAVVDRDPVVRNVVEVNDALALVRYRQGPAP